jgi:hypothetical protein
MIAYEYRTNRTYSGRKATQPARVLHHLCGDKLLTEAIKLSGEYIWDDWQTPKKRFGRGASRSAEL